MIVRKRHGFAGQHHLVVPNDVVRSARRHPLLASLLPTAAGYFPRAAGHYVVRPQGVPEVILILCWSGRGWFELGGRRQTIDAGESVFIPARAAHSYGADDNDPWSIVWAHAMGTDLALFLRELGVSGRARKLRLSADGLDRLGFHRVYQMLAEGYSLPHLLASASALRFVLAEMLRSKLAPEAARTVEADPAQRASDWMRQHLDRRVSLSDLARQMGASVSHLSGMFRKKTGYPPMDYFARLKIQHACGLLDTTASQIKEVGAAIGYPDPYYFSRLFRHIMGVSPRAYRGIPKG
jgi:AraC family transcriptional regulator of arabinose operon